jgi:hypothetical protein
MPNWLRGWASILGAGAVCAALLAAPAAPAKPTCTNTGPNTTQCQSPGNAQIVTTPRVINPYPFWPYGGGFIIGFGGVGW